MKNNLLNQALTYIGTSPSKSPNKGEMYYNKSKNKMYVYNGTTWFEAYNVIDTDSDSIYVRLYEEQCANYPDRVDEFYNILMLCNEDYRQACLIIENSLLEK